MNTPMVVLRVGYMDRYDGPATIVGGGEYIHKHGVGGEVFNFKPSYGKCFGYAMTRNLSGLNLSNLDKTRRWSKGDELHGVDVVFIAKHPEFGQVVVGWYRDATVFHKEYRVRRGQIQGMSFPMRRFLCSVPKESVHLLPVEMRNFTVPNAPTGNKGFPGQSNVWYPSMHFDNAAVRKFHKTLSKYITSNSARTVLPGDEKSERKSRRVGGRKGPPDHAHNARVEKAAVDAVWAFYENQGYKLKSVESENVGWDLSASLRSHSFKVEVKGTSGPAINFELTPNEYSKLIEHHASYRVCVVCCALDEPQVFELKPKPMPEGWSLVSVKGDIVDADRKLTI